MRDMHKSSQCKVLLKDEKFRKDHMKVKNLLFNRTSTEQLKELSRASMFPLYIKALIYYVAVLSIVHF